MEQGREETERLIFRLSPGEEEHIGGIIERRLSSLTDTVLHYCVVECDTTRISVRDLDPGVNAPGKLSNGCRLG